MEIKYRDIVLRDEKESDIDDWIRWYNTETEWADWDAPDEPVEPVDPAEYRRTRLEKLAVPREGFRSYFELDTADGHHIGSVTSYAINADWKWIPWNEAEKEPEFRLTLGIGICDSRFWGRGLGTQAVAAFAQYCRENGFQAIYLQTWSGNIRMIRAAQRIGFVECNRFVGNRQIHGGIYDGLTFRLDTEKFLEYLNR